MSMYSEIEKDFIYRTRENLFFIENSSRGDGTPQYETTQLVNSLLGLIIFIHEKEIAPDCDIPLSIQNLILYDHRFTKCQTVSDLIHKLRNAIAHFNIKFSDNNGDITGVTVSNKDPDTDHLCWKASISVTGLREIVIYVSEMIQDG